MENKDNDLSKHFGSSDDNSDIYDDEYYERIRQRMRERRKLAEKRRVRRNRITALLLLALIVLIVILFINSRKGSRDKDNVSESQTDISSGRETSSKEQTDSQTTPKTDPANNDTKTIKHKIETKDGMTFVDGILIVNKTYSLPSSYNPGNSQVAYNAFEKMSAAAANDGITLFINSGFRSYSEQETLYNGYAYERGTEEADRVSSRPGHSEHQTGLTFDVNSTEFDFEYTDEAKWIAKHCAEYGFIVRYPKGKEKITGYAYEPWHIRYLGVETAKKVTESGLCLEEYLGVTSDYKYAK